MRVRVRPDPQREPLVDCTSGQAVELGAPGLDDRDAGVRCQLDHLADALVWVQPRPDVERERGYRGPQRFEHRVTPGDDLGRASGAPAPVARTARTARGAAGLPLAPSSSRRRSRGPPLRRVTRPQLGWRGWSL